MASTTARTTIGGSRQWIERLARLGYAAKGVTYLVVGWIAAGAAFGAGQATGSEGALRSLLDEPFGEAMLVLVAIGLAGYAVWRAVQGVIDPEGKGSDVKGLAARAFMVASAAIHGTLAVAAVGILVGDPGAGGEQSEGWTARLMQQPAGPWLVALVGLGVLVAAGQQAWLALGEGYRKRVRLDRLPAELRRWVPRLARLGLAARAVVFAIIGAFLLVSAVQADPQEAKGLGEALRTLQQQPFGPWLLALVALGLMAYGVYELVKARYREISAPALALG